MRLPLCERFGFVSTANPYIQIIFSSGEKKTKHINLWNLPGAACTPSPCQNGATCEDSGFGSPVCTCAPGFAGVNCEFGKSNSDIYRHRLKQQRPSEKLSCCIFTHCLDVCRHQRVHQQPVSERRHVYWPAGSVWVCLFSGFHWLSLRDS